VTRHTPPFGTLSAQLWPGVTPARDMCPRRSLSSRATAFESRIVQPGLAGPLGIEPSFTILEIVLLPQLGPKRTVRGANDLALCEKPVQIPAALPKGIEPSSPRRQRGRDPIASGSIRALSGKPPGMSAPHRVTPRNRTALKLIHSQPCQTLAMSHF